MRYPILFIPFLLCVFSCREDKEDLYTGNEITYNLYQVSQQYDYEGKVSFKEMKTGELELTIQLSGDTGSETYYFPAHLHYGAYDKPGAPMAVMLDPIDIKILKSITVLNRLSSGEKLGFDELKNFDGHIKVHLAADGPDYKMILVAGNIGSNDNSAPMDMENITLCAPM